MSPGCLWVVATPIGNLSDLTPRVTEALQRASVVAAEDTRRTRKILSHLGLSKPLLRCDEAAEGHVTPRLLESILRGEEVALATDAGTPGISDPGARLIAAVHEAGGTVVPVAGPSAVTTALSVCGFRATPFRFLGFLPRKEGARKREFQRMLEQDEASVFFESPHRLARTLAEMAEFAPDRRVLVARELTKQHEELVRAPLRTAADHFAKKPCKGEFTVVVAPPDKADLRAKRRRIGEEE